MRFSHPDGHVFYRKMAHNRPKVSHGEGVFLFDDKGRRYLDASGGPLVVNVGHGRTEIVEAMREQGEKAAYTHAVMFTSDALENYCATLAPHVPLDHPRFFFLSSGSEVVEAAIKLARQIQLSRGEGKRSIVISRSHSYHGMTLGALSASGRPGLRSPYLDMMTTGAHIQPPYSYRDSRSGVEMADLLEERILEVGAHNVAAFLAEPVSGASLGAASPDDAYWPRIREICDRHGVLLIADEVLVGFGRTGRFWALSKWNVRPDLLVSSKGIASGYFPLGFVAASNADVERLRTTLGDFNHGGTFSHHPVGAAAGLATLRILEREHLIDRARDEGAALGARLREKLGGHSHVGDIRGEGMFWGLELVADRATKRAFAPEDAIAWRIFEAAFQAGVIVYYSQGCVDGRAGDIVMVGPPFILQPEHTEEIVSVLAEAIDQATAQAGRGAS